MSIEQPTTTPPTGPASLPGRFAYDSESSRPLIVAHRGFSARAPENSLAAVRLAIACGAGAIEIDVRSTSDGEPVVLHDATLGRTTNAGGPLSSWSHKDLRAKVRLLGGRDYRVPALAEVLAVTTGRLPLAIEIKEPSVTPAVLREIDNANATEWVTIWSFYADALETARSDAPDIPRAFLCRRLDDTSDSTARRFLDQASRLGVTGVSFFPEDVSADVIDEAHGRELAVYSGTVNARDTTAAFAARAIDALITDDPLACANFLTLLEEERLEIAS